MFRCTSDPGFLTVLNSSASNPLNMWERHTNEGHIKRVVDIGTQSMAIDIMGKNVKKNFIRCPSNPSVNLGITFPILVLIVKNLNKYFDIEIQLRDDKKVKRCFHTSNHQTIAKVLPSMCSMPMRLDNGWNQVQINLKDITKRAYGTNYVETVRISVHANCRVQRVYFSDRLYERHELPDEFAMPMSVKTPKFHQKPICS